MNFSSKIHYNHKWLIIFLISTSMILFSHIANYAITLAQTPTPDEIATIGLPEAPEPELQNVPTERFAGTVTDDNGTLLAATVAINDESVQANADGTFVLHVPRDENNRYRISADLMGYAPIDYTHIGVAISELNLSLNQANSFTIDPTALIQVEDDSGLRITIPANGLVDANGNLATEPLTLWVYAYDLTKEQLPGDMSARNSEGNLTFMESIGAFHASFIDAQGNEYNLADGTTAEVSIELKSAEELDAVVMVSSFDHEQGVWIEEGVATHDGNRLIGTVSHFSEWNFELEMDNPACIKLTVDLVYWALNQPFNIRVVVPSVDHTQVIHVNNAIEPHVLYNLPPDTSVEFYMPTDAPFPFAIIDTGAPWTGPSEPGYPLIPEHPYDGCNAQLYIDDTLTSDAGISGTKYNDQNGNGIRDGGEPGLANWTILLQGPNGSTISTVTDGNGDYSFSDLPPVAFTVTEVFKDLFIWEQINWAQTMPTTGFYTTTLTADQTMSGLDFGNQMYQDEECVTHWDVHIPLNLPYVDFHMGIHNRTDMDHSYQIEIFPFPGLYGLTEFTTLPALPITVPANSSEPLLVRVDPKPTMDLGVNVRRFQVVVTNLDTGISFGCGGQMWNQETNLTMFPTLGADPEPPQVGLGNPVPVGIQLENRRLRPIEAHIEVAAMFEPEADQIARRNQAADVLSINGLPVGEHFTQTIVIPPDGSIEFEVEVALLADVDGVGDIMFHIDDDGDGEDDSVVSVLVHTGLFSNNPTLSITPTDSTIRVSDIYTINLHIDDIKNFYANELIIRYDPEIIEVLDADPFSPGVQILHGDFFTPDTVIRNSVDNISGTIRYVTSLQDNKPGISGTGTLAQIVVRGLVSGTSPLTFEQIILSDPQSAAIEQDHEHGAIHVQPQPYIPAIVGQVILPRRGADNNDGAVVCVGDNCSITDEAGFYTLNDVPLSATETITVAITHQSYLSTSYSFSGTAGVAETLPTVTLLGGDFNQDGAIDILDANICGQAWGSTPDHDHWNARADVTDDGIVNLLDMVAIQFNWHEAAPSQWGSQLSQNVAVGRRSVRPTAQNYTNLQSDALVSILPASLILSNGAMPELEIHVDSGRDIYGFTVELSFDPTVVQVRDADPQAEGIQIAPGDFLETLNQFVVINRVDNEAGIIELSMTQTYPAESRSGGGVLGRIPLKVVGQGRSDIRLTSIQLTDNERLESQVIIANHEHSIIRSTFMSYLPIITQ